MLVVGGEDRGLMNRLQRAVGPTAYTCVSVANWSELEEHFRHLPPTSLVVADPYVPYRPGAPLAEELREFLERFRSATVIAAIPGGPDSFDHMRRLSAWGVSQLLTLDFDTTPRVVREHLEVARIRSLRFALAEEFPREMGLSSRRILDRALEVALDAGRVQEEPSGRGRTAPKEEVGEVKELAQRLHISHRTLVRRCHRRGLPPPKTLLRWMRLVIAASMLDDKGRTVQDVAVSCGYTSDTSLRRALRLSGLPSPFELRKVDAFQTVLNALFHTIARDVR